MPGHTEWIDYSDVGGVVGERVNGPEYFRYT
jgi:hypothetical protein